MFLIYSVGIDDVFSVDDGVEISQHLLSTVDSLLEDASSKLWRARVGACGALTDIIVGREWQELGDGGPVLNDDDLYGGSNIGASI